MKTLASLKLQLSAKRAAADLIWSFEFEVSPPPPPTPSLCFLPDGDTRYIQRTEEMFHLACHVNYYIADLQNWLNTEHSAHEENEGFLWLWPPEKVQHSPFICTVFLLINSRLNR